MGAADRLGNMKQPGRRQFAQGKAACHLVLHPAVEIGPRDRNHGCFVPGFRERALYFCFAFRLAGPGVKNAKL